MRLFFIILALHPISQLSIDYFLYPAPLGDTDSAFDLHISIEIYHRIFSPLYKMPYIKRNAYIQIMDRNNLHHLTRLQKINCMYCGYTNGVIRYWAKIAGDTEHYWCGIQHKNKRRSCPRNIKQNLQYTATKSAL